MNKEYAIFYLKNKVCESLMRHLSNSDKKQIRKRISHSVWNIKQIYKSFSDLSGYNGGNVGNCISWICNGWIGPDRCSAINKSKRRESLQTNTGPQGCELSHRANSSLVVLKTKSLETLIQSFGIITRNSDDNKCKIFWYMQSSMSIKEN